MRLPALKSRFFLSLYCSCRHEIVRLASADDLTRTEAAARRQSRVLGVAQRCFQQVIFECFFEFSFSLMT